MNSLPDDALLKILAFVPASYSISTVRATAVTCRRYNLLIHHTVKSEPILWKPLLAVCHPVLTEAAAAMSALPAVVDSQTAVHRSLCLAVENMIEKFTAEFSVALERMAAAEGRREADLKVESCRVVVHDHLLPVPTSGTTATCTPSADGTYSEPVYFDWMSNSRKTDSYFHLVRPHQRRRVASRIGPVLSMCLAKMENVAGIELLWRFLYYQHEGRGMRYGAAP